LRRSRHPRSSIRARYRGCIPHAAAVDFTDNNYTKQLKAAAILSEQANKQPNHPGIAHYLIHSYDFAPLAAMCVSTAQRYSKIAPAAPHALHMPSHIYSILGMWDQSIRSNLASKTAAEAQGFGPVAHQVDFLVYAYLQRAEDGAAKELIDSMLPIFRRAGNRHSLGRNSSALCS
jgi:hypothetical protein